MSPKRRGNFKTKVKNLRSDFAQLATFLQGKVQSNKMRNISMSKSIALFVMVLSSIGSNVGAVSQSNSAQIQNGTLSQYRPNVALVNQCHSEARARHSNGTFTLNRFNQSPDMRRHTRKLASFCSAYEGQRVSEYVAQLGVAAETADATLAFANACKGEARAGHTLVFHPSAQHIERMASICDSMARDTASR
jgi:hypothetical protein